MKLSQLPQLELSNGQLVASFVPENANELAVVDLNVLKRLASLLPKADIYEIVKQMHENLMDVHNIEEYVDLLSNEVNFHKTVNLITVIEKEEIQQIKIKTPH